MSGPWDNYGAQRQAQADADAPWNSHAGDVGVDTPKRTWGEAAKDTGLGIVQGGVNLVGGLASLVEMTNPINGLRRTLGEYGVGSGPSSVAADLTAEANEGITRRLSPAMQAKKQELANTEGFVGSAKKVLTDPALLTQFGAEQVANLATLGAGSVAVGARAASAASNAARASALARGATAEAAEAAARQATEGVANAAVKRALPKAYVGMESGNANVQAINDALAQPDEVWEANPRYQQLVAAGLSPEAAKQQIATAVGGVSAAVTAPFAYLGGKVAAPFEADVFTRTLMGAVPRSLSLAGAGRVASGVGREAAEEAVQEGGSQFGVNVGMQQVDPNRDLLEGVPEAAGTGAAVGGAIGGGLGVANLATARPRLPERGPLGRVANAAGDQGTPAVELAPPMPGQQAQAEQAAPGGVRDVPAQAQAQPEPPAAVDLLGDEQQPTAQPLVPAPVRGRTGLLTPPWMDPATGATREPSDQEIRAQIVAQLADQLPDGVSTNFAATAAAKAWGVPKGRVRDQVRAAMKEREAQVFGLGSDSPATEVAAAPAGPAPQATNASKSLPNPPPWINQETGEFTEPSDDQIRAQLDAQLDSQVAAGTSAGTSMRLATDQLAAAWGVSRDRVRSQAKAVLSAREKQLLQQVKEGASPAEAAATPSLATPTITPQSAGPGRARVVERIRAADSVTEADVAELGARQTVGLGAAAQLYAEVAGIERATALPIVRGLADAGGKQNSRSAVEVLGAAQAARRAKGALQGQAAAPDDVAAVSPLPATPRAAKAAELLGARPGQVVRIAGQGRDLQAGSRFRVSEILVDGGVRLEPVAGGDGFTLNRRELEREVREGAAFEVDSQGQLAPRAGLPVADRPPLAARMGNREVEVASFEDASRRFLELKDTVDVGGMEVVELVDQSGKAVGWIGPQGEVYAGDFHVERKKKGDREPAYIPPTMRRGKRREVLEGEGTSTEAQASTGAATSQDGDRRANEAERARIDALPADERDAEIAQLRAEKADLQRQLDTDPLTGVLSRSAYQRDLPSAAGVAVIDLKLFKGYNTVGGQTGGDQVLRAFGQAMRDAQGEGVAPYRSGGDEFTFLATKDLAAAQAAVDRLTDLAGSIRLTLEHKGVVSDVHGVPFTAGFGTDEKSADTDLSARKGDYDRNALPESIRTAGDLVRGGDAQAGGRRPDPERDLPREAGGVATPAAHTLETPAQAGVSAPRPATIKAAAHEAATSPKNDLPAPTEGQIEAGNYKKGKVRLHGLELSIENPAGSRRRPEWPPLKQHYGYIRRTEGADGDHVDVFVGDKADDPLLPVFVVNQVNRDGSFDEHKIVLGFPTEEAARAAYMANYSKGWTGLGSIRAMSLPEFKTWLRDGDTSKPVPTELPTPKVSRRGGRASYVADENTLAAYFQPGRVVQGYGSLDRVIQFMPSTDQMRWHVRVIEANPDGTAVRGAQPRLHSTVPSAKELATVLGLPSAVAPARVPAAPATATEQPAARRARPGTKKAAAQSTPAPEAAAAQPPAARRPFPGTRRAPQTAPAPTAAPQATAQSPKTPVAGRKRPGAFSIAGRAGSDRASWAGFPAVEIAEPFGPGQRRLRDHADYAAAKAGDNDAALRLAQDYVTDDVVSRIKAMAGDRKPVLVPVVAQEESGNNAIPQAFASVVAERLGLDVQHDIVQSVRAHHTAAGAYHRIAFQAAFDGPVVAGQDYLILDDAITMGGTLANLRGHIEANGGRVIGATVLTGHPNGATMALSDATLQRLRETFGNDLETYLRDEFGFGVEHLSEGEAGHILAARTLDAVRDRIAQAREHQAGRVHAPGARSAGPAEGLNRPGLPLEQAQALKTKLTAGWGDNSPSVMLIESAEEFPADAKVDPDYRRAEGFYNGRPMVWLNLAQIPTGKRLGEVLSHEALGHYGFENVVGAKQFGDIRDTIARHEKSGLGSGSLQAAIRETRARYPNADADQFAREVVAVMAEKGMRNTLMSRIVAAVRSFLRKLMPSLDYSYAEIQQLLVASDRFLRAGMDYQARTAATQAMAFSQPPAEMVEELEQISNVGKSKHLAERIRQALADLTPTSVKNSKRQVWMGALSLGQVEELASDQNAGAKIFGDAVGEMGADRNSLLMETSEIADFAVAWGSKNKRAAETLGQAIHQSTQDGIDPSKGYTPFRFQYGGQVLEATDANVKAAIKAINEQISGRSGEANKNLIDEKQQLKEMLAAEKARRKKYPAAIAQWNELAELPGTGHLVLNSDGKVVALFDTRKKADQHVADANRLAEAGGQAAPGLEIREEPAAHAIYKAFRDFYERRADQTEDALVQRAEDLAGDGIPESARRQVINTMREHFESNRLQGVYFPLQRYGEYYIAGEKDGHTTFLMFEKEGDFNRKVKELVDRGWNVTTLGKRVSETSSKDAPPGTFVADVISQLQKANVSEATQDAIYQLYLKAMPELAMRKHRIHRKNIPGFDPDFAKAFAFHMQHGAHQLARLRHMHKAQGALDLLKAWQEDRRRAPGAAGMARQITAFDEILAELNDRMAWIANPTDSAWANMFSSLGFVWYLGISPAAALVNLSQVPIITLPHLAATYGWTRSINMLLAGMRDSMRTNGRLDRVLTGEELLAHAAMKRSGAIDLTLAHNQAGIAESGMAGYNPKWEKVMEGVSWAFHKAEVVNREATAIAAYRLAREDGKTFDEAVRLAHEAVMKTHYDYSNQARARYMRHPVAKVAFMFKQYSLNTAYFLGRNLFEATAKADPLVKKQARRKLVGVLGMTSLFAGVLGLPMMSTVFGALNAVAATFGDDDEPWDAETEFRNFLNDHLGEGMGELVASGAANKLTGADIASRTSLSQLFFRDADRELEGRAAYHHYLEQIAGPIGGIGKNLLVGKQMLDEGHLWRGVEYMLPKAFKDVMKGLRYSSEGVNSLRGDPLIEDVTLWQTLLQLNGFTPEQVAKQYDANRSLKNYEQAILGRRQRLLDAYAMATRLGDAEGRQAAREKIRAFNRANPEVMLNSRTLRRSLRDRLRYSERAANGIVLDRRLARRIREDVRFGASDGA